MSSPRYLFRWMSDAEFAVVRAYAVQVATGGQISSLGGGAKNSTYALMDTADFLDEVEHEIARRARTVPVNKVYSDFRTNRLDAF